MGFSVRTDLVLIFKPAFRFWEMWQFYPLILALATCGGVQIYWLNLGLARFDALYNVPVFQCCWMLFGVITGGV